MCVQWWFILAVDFNYPKKTLQSCTESRSIDGSEIRLIAPSQMLFEKTKSRIDRNFTTKPSSRTVTGRCVFAKNHQCRHHWSFGLNLLMIHWSMGVSSEIGGTQVMYAFHHYFWAKLLQKGQTSLQFWRLPATSWRSTAKPPQSSHPGVGKRSSGRVSINLHGGVPWLATKCKHSNLGVESVWIFTLLETTIAPKNDGFQ